MYKLLKVIRYVNEQVNYMRNTTCDHLKFTICEQTSEEETQVVYRPPIKSSM